MGLSRWLERAWLAWSHWLVIEVLAIVANHTAHRVAKTFAKTFGVSMLVGAAIGPYPLTILTN